MTVKEFKESLEQCKLTLRGVEGGVEMNAVTLQIQLDPESINAFIAPKDAVGPVLEENYEEIYAIMCETVSRLEKFGFVRCQMFINQEAYHSKY